ncbi:hypothetical protein GV828_11975 [Flavobacterium sp. NST-5]|uniref:Lipoprotein n=1 Tax=Flavobacterium ichthyis TaxID=2698827 RepID=A0ABW9ZAH9_9FLAO|nr:hypothetical protein [Flavobacterium ichthyis]NBL65918.1 hypothetical protein [Flavobacterium ichthyis]
MERIFKITKCFLIALILISCHTSGKKDSTEIHEEHLNNSKILSHTFPDTVKINKVIEGSLQYDVNNIGFDSDSISSRFLELLLSTSINKELADYKDIDRNRLLSFVDSLSVGKFKFYAVFEKKGQQTLNIAIRDYMYLKPDKNTPLDEVKLRTSDCLFSKEVYVID